MNDYQIAPWWTLEQEKVESEPGRWNRVSWKLTHENGRVFEAVYNYPSMPEVIRGVVVGEKRYIIVPKTYMTMQTLDGETLEVLSEWSVNEFMKASGRTSMGWCPTFLDVPHENGQSIGVAAIVGVTWGFDCYGLHDDAYLLNLQDPVNPKWDPKCHSAVSGAVIFPYGKTFFSFDKDIDFYLRKASPVYTINENGVMDDDEGEPVKWVSDKSEQEVSA